MRALSLLKHLILAAAGLATLALPFLVGQAHGEPLAGPVTARVVRVIDGDSFEAAAQIWINQTLTTQVRIAQIDAPENGWRAKCANEEAMAEKARAYLASLIEDQDVMLSEIKEDKFGGRVDARVKLLDGRDVSELMRAQKLAAGYNGGKRRSWCATAEAPKPRVAASR